MIVKKQCIAMILAGGQGSRLHALTQGMAKPAVPFGAKYRIIDFPLSNCVNSGIDTIGVLTQYQPLVLNEYIGNGQPWDLDRVHGGVFILPLTKKIQDPTGTPEPLTRYTKIFPLLTVTTQSMSLFYLETTYIKWTIPKCLPTILKGMLTVLSLF